MKSVDNLVRVAACAVSMVVARPGHVSLRIELPPNTRGSRTPHVVAATFHGVTRKSSLSGMCDDSVLVRYSKYGCDV